ncbi:MAG: T9SS type A sorting domain-containing protein, partial [bacterium]
GTTPGNTAAAVDFYNYFFIGERDRLISPPISLQGFTNAVLEFQHAYARRSTTMTDSLIVYVSDDCGTTWTKILSAGEDGNGSLATHPNTGSYFVPEVPEDWCMAGWGASCFALDLTPWAGQSNLKIAFETYSGFGNPLYIDNITISQYVGQLENRQDEVDFRVYPNPTEGSFTVEWDQSGSYNRLSLTDHLGREVYQVPVSASVKKMVVEKQKDWSPGIYIIRLSGNGNNALKKLIIY